jgi:hypothetical protein
MPEIRLATFRCPTEDCDTDLVVRCPLMRNPGRPVVFTTPRIWCAVHNSEMTITRIEVYDEKQIALPGAGDVAAIEAKKNGGKPWA